MNPIRKPHISHFFILILISILFTSLITLNSLYVKSSSQNKIDFQKVLEVLNVASIEDHLKFLSSLRSRITGYPGCEAAANYLRSFWESLGMNVSEHTFKVVVPVSYGANITILNHEDMSLRIYAMEPNLVVPVIASNLSGPIIYVNDGAFKDFDNKSVDGSIVLMNFNSGLNWFNAAKFGAKAVIFIEPEETTYRELYTKHVDLPVNFPRFYMPREDANQILKLLSKGERVEVSINSNMTWERKTGRNIIALMKGTTYPDKIIILSAHYDSYSIAPALSPGANDAVGIATLLEISRILNQLKPKYSIMFVAYSGHHQLLAGSRKFVSDFFFGENKSIGDKVILQLNLQISTLSNVLITNNAGTGTFPTGWSYAWHFSPDPWRDIDDYIISLVDSLRTQLGKNYVVLSTIGTGTMFVKEEQYGLFQYGRGAGAWPDDSGPFSFCLLPAISLVTVDTGDHLNYPSDTYEEININNLRNNVEVASTVAYGLAQTDNLYEQYLSKFPTPTDYTRDILGRVVIYNESLGDYQPVSNAIVTILTKYGDFSFYWKIVNITDDEGNFKFSNLPQDNLRFPPSWTIQAFKLNETIGTPTYSPDRGKYSWSRYGAQPSSTDANIGYYVVFKSASIVVFDTISPRTLSPVLQYTEANVFQGVGSLEINEFNIHVAPDRYGANVLWGRGQSAGILFVPPDTKVEGLFYDPKMGRIPLGIFNNASSEHPEGYGYSLKAGEQVILFGPYETAKDFYYVNKIYLDEIQKHGITKDLPSRNAFVKDLLDQAEEALKNKEYSRFYGLSMKSWSYAQRIYEDIRNLYSDTISTLPFFAFLMTPFSIIFALVVFGAKGRKTIFITIAIMVITVSFFSFVHPSFSLAANAPMLVMTVAMILLTSPAVAILLSNVLAHVKKLAFGVSGIHFSEISKGSALLLAFNVGFENMRRRKLRTTLTLMTIILLTIALILFSSLQAITLMATSEQTRTPPYQGIYFRHDEWWTLSKNLLYLLEVRYSNVAKILPRAWLYNSDPTRGVEDTRRQFWLWKGNESTTYYAVMGLTPEEDSLGLITSALIDGRWFIPTDLDVCVLPTGTANALNISVGDKIRTLGRELTVVGILDSDIFNYVKDIDGEEVTPWDRTIPNQFNMHVDSNVLRLVIVPFKLLIQYNPGIYTISVVPDNPEDVPKIAEEMFKDFPEIGVLYGFEDKVYVLSLKNVYTAMGWEMQIVPIIIGAFMIFNIMLGSTHERRREIFTFSTVGLSPLHVLSMFLAESVSHAILGSLLGYTIAMSVLFAASQFHVVLPVLNYSSSWVVTTVAMIMVVTILSTIYPARLASKLVTPSLERTWSPPTKPVGDTWDVPLPFSAANKKEASALSKYLKEYVTAHMGAAETEIFSASDLALTEEANRIALSMNVRLVPYEQGVIQHVTFYLSFDRDTNHWVSSMVLTRKSGSMDAWRRLNLNFIDAFRKQLLLWRSLSKTDRKRYEEEVA